MSAELDVLIVGAGLSGIAAAVHLKMRCPGKRWLILESRANLGGTWDLFRYPGVRSDSDMYTLGFSFKPWTAAKAIAGGETILGYLEEAAREHGIDRQMRFDHRVIRASWASERVAWMVEAERGPSREPVRFECRFLLLCSGYYDYAEGYTPAFPGRADFSGVIVHPQRWPRRLAYQNKRVVVIGSGATAVTLVPALAQSAAKVTMLQRSPSYVVAMPVEDKLQALVRRALPASLAFRVIRWRNILFGIYFYGRCRAQPERVKKWIQRQIQQALGIEYDVARHFGPRYNPWDQRMCIVPDGDLFAAIKSGRAEIVTDEIDTFIENGIRLKSGSVLDADIIVTATGLNVVPLGGIELHVDGERVRLAGTLSYKGAMFSGIPNLATVIGYTNASWTLKCELVCRFLCRLLNYMEKQGHEICVPRNEDASLREEPWLNLTSGYVRRVSDQLPKQGSKRPWRLWQNYLLDRLWLRSSALDDGVMRFAGKGRTSSRDTTVAAGSRHP
ncbi:MAG: NAD(P)/FAD-dependent oxidoreductase [Steroidobacteraceae bacterium]